ncbi:MAG TPA: FtsX-like permease family protein [Jatrophihabitans sp.]|nr:FtsX-like permease family protein [Jatrophihabitans sp.]
MLRLTVLGVLAHRVRYAMTALAVLLGVAFIAGTLVLTDTIGRTFDGLFVDIYHDTSAVVRGQQAFSAPANFASVRPAIPDTLVAQVRAVPGVREVRVGIDGYAQLVGTDGKAIGNPAAGAPTLGQAWNATRTMNPYRFLPGSQPPVTATEVAIDKHSADAGHLRVGDRVTVLTKRAPAVYRIVGIFRWGSADSPLGASITLFDATTAANVLGEPGKVSEIDVAADPGVSQAELVHRLSGALAGARVDIVTGQQVTREGQSAVRKALGFFNTFLLAFALIALFVGSFLIFNTFSIVVAQRLRELGLLRAVGASRLQVTASVLGESTLIGLLASAAGLGAGIGLAVALRALLVAFGIDIPSTGLSITGRTVLVSMLAGTVVTVLAALQPARRAGAVAPIVALQAPVTSERPRTVRRTISGATVTGLGLLALLIGLFAGVSDRLVIVGSGAAITFLGVSIFGPVLVGPVARAIGVPLAARGTAGRLARNNVLRAPKRTASSAAALMIGVALVAVMSTLAASIRSSISAVVDRTMRADFVISSGGQAANSIAGLSPSLADRLALLPQVASATGVRADTVRIFGSTTVVLATDPAQVSQLFDVQPRQGQLATLSAGQLAISQHVADTRKLRLGDPVPVTFVRGVHSFTVGAIYGARDLAGDYVLPIAAAQQWFTSQLDFQVYVRLAGGTSAEAGRAVLTQQLKAYPSATLMDRSEYKHAQEAQIDQLLNLVYALLGLALIIALVGIGNTLALSIHERRRELGLLRAVGMTKSQLRRTVQAEAGIVSVFGTGQGLLVGVLLGWAVVAAMHSQGVTRLSVPVLQLLLVALIAIGAGVLASVAPSRRAARLQVLQAIAADE